MFTFVQGASARVPLGFSSITFILSQSLFRDSFFVRASKLWNAFRFDLKSESNVNVIENNLKHSSNKQIPCCRWSVHSNRSQMTSTFGKSKNVA